MKKEAKNVASQIAKIQDNEKHACKTIELLKLKHADLIARVQKSTGVAALCFGLEYQDILPILGRMQAIISGQTQIPQPSGYDIEKAAAAAAEGLKKTKKAKGSKASKSKGK